MEIKNIQIDKKAVGCLVLIIGSLISGFYLTDFLVRVFN